VIPGSTFSTLSTVLKTNNILKSEYGQYVGHLDETTQNHFQNVWPHPSGERARSGAYQKLDSFIQEADFFTKMFSAKQSQFDLYDELCGDESKVVLVNTNAGQLTNTVSSALGAFFISWLLAASWRRYLMRPSQRKPVLCYLDEAHTYIGHHPQIGEVIGTAREANVALTLAMPDLSPTAVSPNVVSTLTKVAFQFVNTHQHADQVKLYQTLKAEAAGDLDKPKFEFLSYLKDITKYPVTVKTPPLLFSDSDRMGDEEFAELKTQMRKDYCSPPKSAPPAAPVTIPDSEDDEDMGAGTWGKSE
jgi:hypothetical protein